MADVETSVTINRPIEEVFDHWADGRLYNSWQPAATKKDVRLLTPEPLGKGSRFRGTFKGAGQLEYEVIGYERPNRLAMRTVVPMGTLHHTLTFESVAGGTLVRQTGDGALRGIFKLLSPIIFGSFRRTFRANDLALKEYLEGKTAAQAGSLAGRVANR
jgi:uncharacterized protein YndB with AHSA1/START domain